MRRRDLVLIHPPSVYDFRKKPLFWGPISDTVPSTPVFDMYPIGFISMAAYLRRKGYSVQIVNLASAMLEKDRLDVQDFLDSMKSEVFGVSLHWLPHAQGSMAISKMLKSLKPESKLVMGGLTATYFASEIMSEFPHVDFIVKGDSGEYPTSLLLESLEKGVQNFSHVPNLSWREPDGRIHHNPITHVQDSLDDLQADKWFLISLALKSRFDVSQAPYFEWRHHPIGATLTCKGCTYDCVTCGGSRSSFFRFFGRSRIAFRSPKKIVEDLATVGRFAKVCKWFYVIGEIRQGGKKYVDELLAALKREKIDLPVMFELFEPAEEDFIRQIASSVPNYGISFSPDSGDPEVRAAQGRNFSNGELEKTVAKSLSNGVKRLDVFFMLGLGRETGESVRTTLRVCEDLMKNHGGDGRLLTYMATLTPCLDPGSMAFEDPRRHGFALRYRTLREHCEAFSMPSWKYFVNYRTANLSVDDIVELTYKAASFMVEVKTKFNLIDQNEGEVAKERIRASRMMMQRIDGIMSLDDARRQGELDRLMESVRGDRGDRVIHHLGELSRSG